MKFWVVIEEFPDVKMTRICDQRRSLPEMKEYYAQQNLRTDMIRYYRRLQQVEIDTEIMLLEILSVSTHAEWINRLAELVAGGKLEVLQEHRVPDLKAFA